MRRVFEDLEHYFTVVPTYASRRPAVIAPSQQTIDIQASVFP
jgi:spermidine synthase